MTLVKMQYGHKTVHYVKPNGWSLCGQCKTDQLSKPLTTHIICRRCLTILRSLKQMQESKIDGTIMMPEMFNPEKMMKRLMDPEVKDIRVFRGTPENLTNAKYRSKYPNLTRKQLRARIKYDRQQANKENL